MPSAKKAKKDAKEAGSVVAAVTKHASGKFTNGNAAPGPASDTSSSANQSPSVEPVTTPSSNGNPSVSPLLDPRSLEWENGLQHVGAFRPALLAPPDI
ncbi:hypothetical protein SCUCBS95973_007494 [Sporothrix curviconia]|uniref:Uncharacterized protein n=1 Tax=Sporothrix curviconia TaxID=1260050 RepID=A0ABP0CF00_9PEZI